MNCLKSKFYFRYHAKHSYLCVARILYLRLYSPFLCLLLVFGVQFQLCTNVQKNKCDSIFHVNSKICGHILVLNDGAPFHLDRFVVCRQRRSRRWCRLYYLRKMVKLFTFMTVYELFRSWRFNRHWLVILHLNINSLITCVLNVEHEKEKENEMNPRMEIDTKFTRAIFWLLVIA